MLTTLQKHGALTRKVGDDFRNKVLSRGNTMDLMEIFANFTGLKAPDASGLLKAKGGCDNSLVINLFSISSAIAFNCSGGFLCIV